MTGSQPTPIHPPPPTPMPTPSWGLEDGHVWGRAEEGRVHTYLSAQTGGHVVRLAGEGANKMTTALIAVIIRSVQEKNPVSP